MSFFLQQHNLKNMYKYMEENFGWLRTAKSKNLTFY